MRYDYYVIRSKRRTISIEVTRDLEIIVRAPKYATKRMIASFVESKEDWIEKAFIRVKEKNASRPAKGHTFTDEELKALAKDAKQVIPLRVAYYADMLGVSYGRISIRSQKTRWGSCSGKGNLNFNCLLMLVPEAVMDYVIVHELCHLFEMNHSKAFWSRVEQIVPDYKEKRRWLKEKGSELIDSLP